MHRSFEKHTNLINIMKKSLSLFVVLFCATCIWALDPIPTSGTLGTCDYEFNSATGILTIRNAATAPEWGGTLELENPLYSPFVAQGALKEVIVEEGVFEIGTGAFFNCPNLEKITFPSTIGAIGFSSNPWQEPSQNYMPFLMCKNLKTLIIKSHYSPDYDNSIDFNNPEQAFGFDPSKVDLYVNDGSVHNFIESGWGVFTIHSLPALAEGSIGDKLNWKLSEDGKLTISGEGEIPNYTLGSQPWAEYVAEIKEVVVGEGITHIGSGVFGMHANIEKAYLPATLLTIGASAFAFTPKLTEIVCAAIYVPTLGEYALPKISDETDRYIYVWNYMVSEYQNDANWNIHEIRPFGVEATSLDASVEASAQADSENSLYINWLQVNGATVYVITLTAEDGSFSIEVRVNAKGEVTSYVRKAPSRPNYVLTEEAEGWSLLINGLEYGKNYNITILAQNGEQTIATFNTSTSTITESIENQSFEIINHKFIKDGQLLIEKNGKTFNAQGAEIK